MDIEKRRAAIKDAIEAKRVDEAVKLILVAQITDGMSKGQMGRVLTERAIHAHENAGFLRGTAAERLGDARLIMRVKAPYMRALLTSLAVREVWGLGTIGVTEKGVLIYDPAWLAQWSPEQIAGLLAHECLHLMQRHPSRCGSRDRGTFNKAGDLAINPSLVQMGMQLPDGESKGLFPADYKWPENLTADEYYERLVQKDEQEGKGKKGKGQPGQGDGEGQDGEGEGDDEGEGDGDGEGQGSGAPGTSGNPVRPKSRPGITRGHCGSCAGHALEGEEAVADEKGKTERDMDRIMSEVARDVREEAAKRRGNMPAMLKRWADESLEPPKVPWQQKLNHAVRRAVNFKAGDGTPRWVRPSRRQNAFGTSSNVPILPVYEQPVPQVAIIVDTSGSMGPSDLAACLRECGGVLKAVGAEVQFVACDARVNVFQKVSDPKKLVELLKGGGGTDFRPPLKAVDDATPRPEVVVFMTDGCGPAPVAPPRGVQVVWLLVGRHRQKPWAVPDGDAGYGGGQSVSYGTFVEVDE